MGLSTDLTSSQQTAALHVEGPALVIAGAGSGKTRVVISRIAYLLQLGTPASQILAVTFTNKAAQEMRERIEKISSHFVLTSTFHSLSAKILRESIQALGFSSNFTIYDEDDSEKLLKECFSALNVKEERGAVRERRAQISSAKNNLLSWQDVQKEDSVLASLYDLYQRKLQACQALDFDDLLFLTVRLFKEHPSILKRYQERWSFILVDEYQDTNKAQHEIIRYLAQEHQNLFAVGDPDQSIYSWRGATVRNILEFEKDFPSAQIVILDQNFRSTNQILEAANALIAHNENPYKKKLWSTRGAGEKIGFYLGENEKLEAHFVAAEIHRLHEEHGIDLRECAIFYRTNFQSRLFEDALLKFQLPYVIFGGLSFYQRKEIKDVLSFLRVVNEGADFISFTRTINLPKRGFGEAAVQKLQAYAEAHALSIFDAAVCVVERREVCKFSPKQYEGLTSYVNLIRALREMIKQKEPLSKIVIEAIDRSSYFSYLKEDPETYEERKQNVQELIAKAAEAEEKPLSLFLEELSLRADVDKTNAPTDAVHLMTLHNSKGLEFKVAFVVGMEEDLLPHINSKENPEALQEERRLCYVGMTRAKEHLFFTAARSRFLWGSPRYMRPSPFLYEIPTTYLNNLHPLAASAEEEATVFSPGDAVYHADFGRGIVQKQYETSLGITYDVFFPAADTLRSLVAKYAKLKRL